MDVKPLESRTMTLDELQTRTLDIIRRVKKQLFRQAHQSGLSDSEFVDEVLEPFETEILQDRHILEMHGEL